MTLQKQFEGEHAEDIVNIIKQFNEQEAKFEILALYVKWLEKKYKELKCNTPKP